MTTEEIIKGLESVKTECGKHLNEGFTWICKPINKAIEVLKREPCTDAVSREEVKKFIESFIHEIITESGTDKNAHTNEVLKEVARGVGDIPPVTPEKTTITYKDCSEAMMKMWIDNVLTDGQYNKIMDKLNAKYIADMRG